MPAARPRADLRQIRRKRHVHPPQHVETLIVGAGQAGLTTAYHLRRRGRDVSNTFTELDVGSRTATAAFAYSHHLIDR